MDYDTFTGEVQNRTQLGSREEALKVSRITLETLSHRIEPGAAENLAAQLPEEIGRHLAKVDAVDSFNWDEFVDRIVDADDYQETDAADAVHHARVVVDVIEEAVDANTLWDIEEQFPPDEGWEELFALAKQDEKSVEEEQRPE